MTVTETCLVTARSRWAMTQTNVIFVLLLSRTAEEYKAALSANGAYRSDLWLSTTICCCEYRIPCYGTPSLRWALISLFEYRNTNFCTVFREIRLKKTLWRNVFSSCLILKEYFRSRWRGFLTISGRSGMLLNISWRWRHWWRGTVVHNRYIITGVRVSI